MVPFRWVCVYIQYGEGNDFLDPIPFYRLQFSPQAFDEHVINARHCSRSYKSLKNK